MSYANGVNTNLIIIIALHLQNSARLSVPGGASVACSTAKAVEWDAAWSNNLDPSGRAALGVHLSDYDQQAALANAGVVPPKIIDTLPRMLEVSASGVAIHS
jgi:asparagine synthase (glutamine-hydrolysing)